MNAVQSFPQYHLPDSPWNRHNNRSNSMELRSLTSARVAPSWRIRSESLNEPLSPTVPVEQAKKPKVVCSSMLMDQTPISTYNNKALSITAALPPQNIAAKNRRHIPLVRGSYKNQKAARVIQRYMCGWMERLKYRVQLLEYKLATVHVRKQRDLIALEEEFEQRKNAIRKELEEEAMLHMKREFRQSKRTYQDGQRIMTYLRNENKQLRARNKQILQSSMKLEAQNRRLEKLIGQTYENIKCLELHLKQLEATNKKLLAVLPRYRQGVQNHQEAASLHRQYCVSEHAMKLMYVRGIGSALELMEKRGRDPELNDTLAGIFLELEGQAEGKDLPEDLRWDEAKR